MANQKITELSADTSPTIDDLVVIVNDPGGSPTNKKVTLESARNLITSSAYLQYRDAKTQNTAGGTFTAGSWQTRVLNTEVSDVGGYGTLASNQITLTAGTYLIHVITPGFGVSKHQTRLQNVTDATTVLIGTSEYSDNATPVSQSASTITGIFTIGASKALEVQHQCETTRSTNGMGVAANFTTEVYTIVELWKIG